MRVLLLLSLVVGWSLGEAENDKRPPRQIYGNRPITIQPTLQPSYLGPTQPLPCPPSVVYKTKVRYSTVVIPSTVYNNDIRIVTQTHTRTQQAFSTAYSEVVRTQVVPSFQFQTVTVTQSQGNVRTTFITLPGGFNDVVRTSVVVQTQQQFRTRFETRTQQIQSTVTRNVFSTTVAQQQVVSTIFQTQTITRTQQLPGQTRTVQSTRYSTVFSTIIVPGQDAISTQTVFRTNVVTQTITNPGQTQVITSTQVIPITSTIFSQVVVTNTQTQFLTRTQFDQQLTTVYTTHQQSSTNTRYVTVPQQVIQTQYSTQVIPSTVIRQQVIPTVIHVPGQTQIRTVFRTVVHTRQLPGQIRTHFVTHIVYNTNYVTSTVLNQHYHTITATRTIQPYCTGYGFRKPAGDFNPYSG